MPIKRGRCPFDQVFHIREVVIRMQYDKYQKSLAVGACCDNCEIFFRECRCAGFPAKDMEGERRVVQQLVCRRRGIEFSAGHIPQAI